MHIDAATLKMMVALGAMLLAAPSPLGKLLAAIQERFVPAPIARLLKKLNSETVNELIDHLATPGGTLDMSSDYLIRLAGKEGVPMPKDTSVAVCKWVGRIFADEIAHLRKQKKAA